MDQQNGELGGAAAGVDARERILERSLVFGRLGGASLRALLDLGRVEVLLRREQIIEEGAAPRSVFLLGAGRVGLERSDEGRTFPVGHRGPGDIVGEPALAGAPVATEAATVLDDGHAVVLPVAGLRRLIAADPAVRGAVAAALVQSQLAAESRLASLLLRTVEARLIELLAAAARRWGQPHPAGEIVAAPFTHAQMALLIGSTRETVTLLLGKLKRAGLIAFDRRRVVIRDAVALARRAGAA